MQLLRFIEHHDELSKVKNCNRNELAREIILVPFSKISAYRGITHTRCPPAWKY
jgi:hypothetical protein